MQRVLRPDVIEKIAMVEKRLAPAYILRTVNDRQLPWNIWKRMQHWRVPGVSIAVINKGIVEWTKGYGEAEAKGNTVNTESIFQTGSIGKTLTAVTILALADRDDLELDRDVNEYLVSWQLSETGLTMGESVTLERILNHSAGLTVHGFSGYTPGEKLPTLQQMLDGEPPCNSGRVAVRWKPGTEWHYSGGGYLVAQQVIEDVTGRPFPDVVQELVLDSLDMTRTFYRSELDKELLLNAAMGHQADGSIMNGRYRAMPEYGAGGGLWSTPSDLAKLGLSILRAKKGVNGEPLTPVSARNMLTARLGGYGLGIFVRGKGMEYSFSHGGDNTGFHAFLIIFPESEQGAVIMTNGDRGTPLLNEILHAIAEIYQWPELQPIKTTVVTADSARLDSLAGLYELSGIGRIPLTLTDGALHVPDLFGENKPIRLFPVGSHTFVDPIYGWVFAFVWDVSKRIWNVKVTWGLYHLTAVKVD